MEQSDLTSDFLPPDDELLRREKAFIDLFNKFNVDEGSDPELIEDADASMSIHSESNVSGSSFSETSGCETEDDYDTGEMSRQLQPFIDDRVNGWAEKGINFQLKTVDRGVTVEEWLEANQEFTTTSKKYKKTVINENNKTTTITTTQTKTVTTRTSVNMRRNNTQPMCNQLQAIADVDPIEPPRDGTVVEMETLTQPNHSSNDWTSSKRFDIPRGRQKQSTPSRLNRKRKAASPKGKRLSPPKMKLRNRKESIPVTTVNKKGSESDSGFFSTEVSNQASNEFSDEVFNEASTRVLSDGAVGGDHENVLANEQTQSVHSQEEEVSQSRMSAAQSKSRPPTIVVYSPSAGKRFGKRIDEEFMSVTRSDFKKGIDPKYHKYTDFRQIKKCVVPVKQRLVYVPPTDIAVERNANNHDSETDDDLLTSYTTTGRFYRTNSK